ncbi:MAG: AAA family ATPase [Phycisphaera sp.]|nr:AAA family ATPase [Phycisphaera sp.]
MTDHNEPIDTRPLTVRHRPRRLEDMCGWPDNRTLKLLSKMMAANRLPQIAEFQGPAGTGKTTMATILAAATSCEQWDPQTHAPCGQCVGCCKVFEGADEMWFRAAGLFVQANELTSADAAERALHQAREMTEKSNWWGDPNWPWLIVIDEAHRLPLSVRASLLSAEHSTRARYIITTTEPHKLTARVGNDGVDPLRTRMVSFEFTPPSVNELVAWLRRISAMEQLVVDDRVYHWIATTHRGPRVCLNVLDTLSAMGTKITMGTVREVYPATAARNDDPSDRDHESLIDDDDPDAPRVY